jgi:hypothetical protein
VDEGGLQETCAFFLSLKNEINQSKFWIWKTANLNELI